MRKEGSVFVRLDKGFSRFVIPACMNFRRRNNNETIIIKTIQIENKA